MALTNAMLVRWGGGFTFATVPASITTYSRREGYLAVGASGKDEALRIANAILANRANPDVAVTAVLEPAGTDVPYVNFDVGDTITAPDPSGATAAQRVVGITVSEDTDGNNLFVPELSSLRLLQEQYNAAWLKRMANGTLAGVARSASPAVAKLAPKPKPPTDPMSFSMPGPLVIATSGRLYPSVAVFALWGSISLGTAGSTTTTVVLYKNGAQVATASLAAGVSLVERTGIDPGIAFAVGDYASLATTAVGIGAADLAVSVPTI